MYFFIGVMSTSGNSYICKVFKKKLLVLIKKILAKNFTSEKYHFIKDNINVTLLINGLVKFFKNFISI